MKLTKKETKYYDDIFKQKEEKQRENFRDNLEHEAI